MERRELVKLLGILTSGSYFGNNVFAGELFSSSLNTQNNPDYSGRRFGDGRDWFLDSKYGMFVHWGLYSIPAVHEQYQQRYNIPRLQYEQYAKQWNPKDFNPDAWLDLLQEAGMEYLTFTTKHHDGFCMWDTKQTSFNVMNTPYKKDILGMLANACHKRNIPLTLYYSVVDWHNPNYPNKGRHHELPPQPGDNPDWLKYMEFLKAQVRELCTNYGEISGFWWDMNVPEYKDPSINAMIRKLQPNAVINNRGFDAGDYGTPERDYDAGTKKKTWFAKPTEACQSVGMQSWGYRKNEDYYSDKYLTKSIDKYLSGNANYLLNVGPDATGKIPEVSQDILKRIGIWYKAVNESYSSSNPVNLNLENRDVILTGKDNMLYVHLNKFTVGNAINLKPLKTLPIKAVLLNTGEKMECVVERVPYEKEPFLFVRNIPVNTLCNEVPVIKLEFDENINNSYNLKK